MADDGRDSRTRFVAYVYPGWHPDAYRSDIDEWDLLDRYRQRFPDQQPPLRPPDGPYRDDTDECARRHADLARQAGIEGFSYFLYFSPERGLIMAEPMRRMVAQGGPAVAATWCIRLPHDRFPVAPRDHMELPDIPTFDAGTPLEHRPIEALSLSDLESLLGADDQIWSTLAYDGSSYAGTRHMPVTGPDTVAVPTTTPLVNPAAAEDQP